MSIPFFFRPVPLTSAAKVTSTLLDGGLLSNFPIDSLDRTDGEKPRHPTFGITVLPNLPAGNDQVVPQLPLRQLASLVLESPHLLGTHHLDHPGRAGQAYLNQPWVDAHAIAWIPPTSASSTSGSPRPKPKRSTRRVTKPRRNSCRPGTGRAISTVIGDHDGGTARIRVVEYLFRPGIACREWGSVEECRGVVAMLRAGLFIGVDRTGDLPVLRDAAAGAGRMHKSACNKVCAPRPAPDS